MKKAAKKLISSMGMFSSPRWFLYCFLVGIISGLGAIIFFVLLKEATHFFLNYLAGYYPSAPGGEPVFIPHGIRPNRWMLLIVPAIGGLISGLIVYTLAPEAEGHGTDALIDAFHQHRGVIRKRVPIIKTIASAITIGSGGSAGREGPIAQIGAGFASFFASLLKLNDRERRILVLAGAGTGIGAIFRAPLGGAFFATEVLYNEEEFEYEALIPCFLSSIVGYSVYCTFSGYGWGAIFHAPAFTFHNPWQFIFYGLLGLLMALFGYVYVKVFYQIRDRIFRPLKIPNIFKPAIGGLALGGIALFCPQVLGMGYGMIQQAIDGSLTLQFLFLVGLLKIVATSFTISSGGSGGVFAPSLVIGGLLGGAFGKLFSITFPGIIDQPGAFVLVGMASFFAGAAKVPIASMIMVSEMTVGYSLLVPMILASSVAYLFSRKKTSIYEKQVPKRVDSPAHMGDFIVDVLEGIRVEDVLKKEKKVVLIPEYTKLRDIGDIISNTTNSYFPVVNEKNKMIGIISMDDLRTLFFERHMGDLLIAKDIATKDVITLNLEESLSSALKKFTMKNIDELPVVDSKKPNKVIGMLSRRDAILAYNEAVLREE